MFCQNCGAELLPDAAFCEECGTAVETAAIPPIPTQPQARRQSAPPQKKSSPKIGIIILIVALLVVAVVAALWFTGIIGGGKPGGDTPDTSSKQARQTSEKQHPSTAESSKKDDSLGTNGESMQLSTTEIPTAGDFVWFTDKADRWVYGITPTNASTIEDFHALLGSWKGLQTIYDFDGTVLGYGYFTASFEESGSNVAATLDWHFIDWADGNHEELTDREDESMVGSFDTPTMTLGGAGNRIELIFYAMGGKQYAEGKWTVQSGEEVRVALVRP